MKATERDFVNVRGCATNTTENAHANAECIEIIVISDAVFAYRRYGGISESIALCCNGLLLFICQFNIDEHNERWRTDSVGMTEVMAFGSTVSPTSPTVNITLNKFNIWKAKGSHIDI